MFEAVRDVAQQWARLARTTVRAGLLAPPEGLDVRGLTQAALMGGAGVRGLHALHAALDPGREALVDAHRALTYAQTDAEINALGSSLRDHWGASSRAPVALLMENRIEYAVAWFALFRLGVPAVHMGRYSTADEVDGLLTRSKASIVFTSAQTRAVVEEVARKHARLRVFDVDGPHWAKAMRCRGQAYGLAGDSHNVVYTSGTTGRPKGAVRNFGAFGLVDLLKVLERLPLRRGERHLVVAPLYHSGAQVFTLLAAGLGATLVLQEKFDPPQTLEWLHTHAIDSTFFVPTMLQRLLELPDEAFERHPPQLRALVSGAAPFLDPLRRRAIDRFGPGAVFDFYGATELGWVTLVDGHEMLAKPGSLGTPITGQEISICGPDGRRLPPGEIGQVFTRSTQRMDGYLDDETATSEIRRGEWLTVDDLGHLDEDGSLFLTGRARDMVISGGINIYPVELEQALLDHEAIDEVAVIGVADPTWGERLVACVVGRPQPDENMEAWAKQRLAKYKVPRQWVWMDALPRNPTGKVLKRRLVEGLEQ